MERLRVLFVIDHFGRGGAERQLLNLVNNIDRERFEPYVFIAERRGERYVELKKDVGVYGMIDSNERQTLRACRRLRDAISTLKPHVVQAWLEYSVFLSAVALKTVARRPSFFASLRTSIKELYDYEVKWGRLKRKILLWAYRQSDAVTVNSRYLRSQLEGYGVKGVEVVYNGINTETFGELPSKKQLRKTLGLSEDVYYIVFVGALVRRKGIEHLVRAVKNIRRSSFCALIIGDGEMKNEITKLVRGDERFRLMGYIPGAVQLVKASDLLVLPSVYEGLPNVILEAMAVGTSLRRR
ncbi:MAG: glycosyltransferase [Nitrospirae bacterium]|nr:glycosyltransferase [Nitrospirota bacterium]